MVERKRIIAWLFPIALILFANIAVFWQFYFRGRLPFPGDLLVSFFFPWNSGGFAGFDQWTTHKEVIAADVIRQMYPWKDLAFDLIHHFQFPLWNPYNFSGYPLFANLQSSILFPGNILFLFLPTLWAWVALVISLPVIMSAFMYLFLRSLKLSVFASVLGAIAVTNIGFLMVWHEQLIMIQVALFLPLMLFAINRYCQSLRTKYLVLLSVSLAGAIFGGHAQTFIYVFIIVFAYLLFRRVPLKVFLPFLLLGFAIGAVQLFPTAEIYLHSAREGEATRALFAPFVLSWSSLVTIFAPDFFGNPATNNFWGQQYGNFQVYFGVVALIFSIITVICCWTKKEARFFSILGVVGLLFALNPAAYIPYLLNIPIIATGVPARALFIFQFSFAVLAAYGFDYWLTGSKIEKRQLWSLAFLGSIYFSLWFFISLFRRPEILVSRSNLILPTATFLITSSIIVVSKFTTFRKLIPLSAVVLILISIGEYSYLFNKYQPFSKAQSVFPPHPVFDFLQQNAGINRFFGLGAAYVDNNFATYYHVFGPEGYDSLYIKRYGQLLASAKDGLLPKEVLRSDAIFPPNDNYYRNHLFDLLGIKYILDKNDNPQSNWEPDVSKFPADRYQLIWQFGKWKAYERKTALPRFFLAGSVTIASTNQAIVEKIYSQSTNLRDSVILEDNPHFQPKTGGTSNISLLSYQPNSASFSVTTDRPKFLFLSDTFYPGWQATVDGTSVPIYEADYIFRAVAVPAGNHTIIFKYRPSAFFFGLLASLTALLTAVVIATKAQNVHA